MSFGQYLGSSNICKSYNNFPRSNNQAFSVGILLRFERQGNIFVRKLFFIQKNRYIFMN